MENFLRKNKKLLSISLSIICSVFLVAVVVSAATVIGANITSGGTATITGVVKASSTLQVSGAVSSSSIYPWVNNTHEVGTYGAAWQNVYASGTLRAQNIIVGSNVGGQLYLSVGGDATGGGASTTLRNGAAATTTITTGLEIGEASATTTLYVGNTAATTTANGAGTNTGKGGCIALGATSSSPSGQTHLYFIVLQDTGGRLYFTTSTNARDCNY